MKSARRVALSDVPARDYATAYKLGVHHKKVKVDWDHLPFEIQRSRDFSLPYPAIALRVREIEILDFDTIGSHTFFVSRIVSEHAAETTHSFFTRAESTNILEAAMDARFHRRRRQI